MASKRSVELQTEISEQHYQDQGIEGEFSQTEKAKRLREQFRALEADERLFKRQAKLLSTETTNRKIGKSIRRAFIELFTSSKIGLGITGVGRGRRDTSVQSQFRAACIDVYNSLNTDPDNEHLWCPILKMWVPQEFATAAHIFAYRHGQDVMDSVFGIMENPELFSPLNGMIVSQLVEGKFDNGFIVVVPRLPDHPTLAQIALWNNSEPKEYKIRILDPNDREAQKVVCCEPRQTWKDLDGTNVDFRSTFRPRARYLYFHYCIQILRRAWRADQKAAEEMKKEFGKGYWGTIGEYLPESMLRAFIEELGHEYGELLVGVVDDKTTANQENRDLLIAVASNQVKTSRDNEGEDEESDENEDEDEDEDEDENDSVVFVH
jgi:hypothetical protein